MVEEAGFDSIWASGQSISASNHHSGHGRTANAKLAQAELVNMNTPERYVLLNPGPVTLTDSVRAALAGRDMCHREQAFADLMSEVRAQLLNVYQTPGADWTSVLITGSGTAAVESMISSLVQAPNQALVCTNGVYGERMATMLQRAGKAAIQVRSPWQDAIDFAEVENQLRQHASIKHVIAVHHETTTGRLNDLDRLAELCVEYDKRMLIDAVSSFGGERIDFDNWPLDAVAATANKCLHGVPGIAFVVVRRECVQGKTSASSLYLDLATNFAAQEGGFPAFTPAIQSIYALHQALTELHSGGGWLGRHEVYRQRTQRVTEALAEQGIAPLLSSPTARSAVLTAYLLPESLDFKAISDPLQKEGIIIYAGQKHLEEIIFRIAVMGDLEEHDFEKLFRVLRSVLRN